MCVCELFSFRAHTAAMLFEALSALSQVVPGDGRPERIDSGGNVRGSPDILLSSARRLLHDFGCMPYLPQFCQNDHLIKECLMILV